jgi:hypothetical protein
VGEAICAIVWMSRDKIECICVLLLLLTREEFNKLGANASFSPFSVPNWENCCERLALSPWREPELRPLKSNRPKLYQEIEAVGRPRFKISTYPAAF